MEDLIEWYEATDLPDLVSKGESSISVDVLIHSPDADEHQIGWYNYKTMRWQFLCNENVAHNFRWRYFTNKHDRYMATTKGQKVEIADPVIISATLVKETDKSLLLDCEGDQVWFPKSQVNFNDDKKELEAPRWLLKEKFPNENL